MERDPHRLLAAIPAYKCTGINQTTPAKDNTSNLPTTTDKHDKQGLETATQDFLQELENDICQQIINVRLHLSEFSRMNNQFDELEGCVLSIMAFCKDISQNILE